MTNAEVKARVEFYARRLAAMRHALDTGCTVTQARRFAEAHWSEFVDMALDLLALTEELAAAEAAPWN